MNGFRAITESRCIAGLQGAWWHMGLWLLLAIPLLAAQAGCRPSPKPQPQRPAAVVVSGDTAGWITPCGCTANQAGGLLRRGSYMAEVRQQHDVVYVDVGGAPAGRSEYQRLKFEAVLRGEMAMGLVAHNLGGPEVALGAAYLSDAARRLGVPFLSANVRDEQGSALAEPVRIVQAGGRRLALVGVTSPRYSGSRLRIEEPYSAVLAALAEVRGQYDSVLVLAYLNESELEELAASLPEADVVVGGPTGQSITPRRLGPTLLTSATNKGKFMVQLIVPPLAVPPGVNAGDAKAWSASIVELGERFGDDPAQKRNHQSYLAELAKRDFAAEKTALLPAPPAGWPEGYRLAGSHSCMECHPADQKLWQTSHHASAWETLVTRGTQVDPYCQQCHTTGYARPGGFHSMQASAKMTSVGCESCHGPSLAHVKDPAVRTPYLAKDQCTHCHDRENSPRYEYEAYWKQIRHGEVKGKSPTTRPGVADAAREERQ